MKLVEFRRRLGAAAEKEGLERRSSRRWCRCGHPGHGHSNGSGRHAWVVFGDAARPGTLSVPSSGFQFTSSSAA